MHHGCGKCIVLDDESYFTFSRLEWSGNACFYTDGIEATQDNVRYASKSKFKTKVLVWWAVSSNGIATPIIRPSEAKAASSDIYMSQCIPKLKQFIEKHHATENYLFWPDLVSFHHSKKTTYSTLVEISGFCRKRTTFQRCPRHVQSQIFGGLSNVKCKGRAGKLRTSKSWLIE